MARVSSDRGLVRLADVHDPHAVVNTVAAITRAQDEFGTSFQAAPKVSPSKGGELAQMATTNRGAEISHRTTWPSRPCVT